MKETFLLLKSTDKLSDIPDFRGQFVICPSEFRIAWVQRNRSPQPGVYFSCISPEQLLKSICRMIQKCLYLVYSYICSQLAQFLPRQKN